MEVFTVIVIVAIIVTVIMIRLVLAGDMTIKTRPSRFLIIVTTIAIYNGMSKTIAGRFR